MDIKLMSDVEKKFSDLALFENSKTQDMFWDNDHISKMMLMAHLNPNWDAASRKEETIAKTCQWLESTLNLKKGDKILDLGCGPGLYTSKLHEMGYKMTGIDYSKRSLKYAQDQSVLKKQSIKYTYMNYLDLDFDQAFDLVVLIYCDFGVLDYGQRKLLLSKIHGALKPGGRLVFDVWTPQHEELQKSYKNWFVHKDQGFWLDKPHMELVIKKYLQDSQVSLKQHIIIDEDENMNVYNLWEQCYTQDTLTALVGDLGFELESLTGDLTGKIYSKDCDTIAMVVRK